MDWTAYAIAWGLAFLCGSIPFAVLIGRAKGVDIRKVGSGNPGATNLGRTLGRKWGVFCFVLDLGKGLLPVFAFQVIGFLRAATGLGWVEAVADPMWQGGSYQLTTELSGQWIGLGVAAVLGHMFSPWIGFKGGKGAATGLGAVLGVFPFVTLPGVICGLVWVALSKLTGYVGLSSCLSAAILPVLTGLNGWRLGLERGPMLVFVGLTALLATLVIVRHRGNLRRLLAGTEPKAAWTGKA
ncbi:MAG: glycerol-3-phosphate 1-O-acyltransferase PlsY [Planctomycetota bacterium]